MPEGDTVHLTAAQQNAALEGRTLTGFELRVPRLATADLTGQTVREVVAVGKHLLHRISSPDGGGVTLHTHLKMEGAWRSYAPGEKWRRPAYQARAILTTADVVAVGFDLGVTELIRREDEDTVVGHLGPDLLGPDWDAAAAVARLAEHPEEPIFVAALDQRNLAGIGNVYANELCFVRGVLPTRPIGEVEDVPALVSLARRMLVANRARWTRTTTGDVRAGRRTWVYGRTGQPCLRCGTPLKGGELGREGVGGIGRHFILGQGDQRDADVGRPGGAVDEAGGGDHVGADPPEAVDALADGKAGRDDVLDDDHLLAVADLEAAAHFELAFDALGVDGRKAEMTGSLVAGNDTADGRRDDF